jgi:hypothetical protein
MVVDTPPIVQPQAVQPLIVQPPIVRPPVVQPLIVQPLIVQPPIIPPQPSLSQQVPPPPPPLQPVQPPSPLQQVAQPPQQTVAQQRPIARPRKTRPKGPPKPKGKKEKPAVCEGLLPFDFTQALRDAHLDMTIGQLMSLDKPPRAAIAKAFRSPRKTRGAKAQATHLAEGVAPTALVCEATIGGYEVPLILDSGSSLNIISLPLFQKLGLKLARNASKAITGIHGNKRLPTGEYDDLPVTVQQLTIPADVVIIDTTAYSLIVGNEWLSKARANIDWDSMHVTLRWKQQNVRVPFQCWTSIADDPDSTSEDEDSDTTDEEEDEEDHTFHSIPEAVAFTADFAVYPEEFSFGARVAGETEEAAQDPEGLLCVGAAAPMQMWVLS